MPSAMVPSLLVFVIHHDLCATRDAVNLYIFNFDSCLPWREMRVVMYVGDQNSTALTSSNFKFVPQKTTAVHVTSRIRECK